MIKKIFFLILCFGFWNLEFVYAGNDQQITCDASGCHKVGTLPLFDETNTYPGYQKTQTVQVQNLRDGDCDLVFTTNRQANSSTTLPTKIFVDVTGNNTSQNDTLSQLYIVSNRSLGKIPVGATTNYSWVAELDPTMGNEYQSQAAKFDLDFNFSCITPTTNTTTTSGGGGNGAPICNAPAPVATTIYSITDYHNGTALLRWNKVASPYTHYLISFGPDRNTFLYGAPNVGADNKYLVSGLTPNARYCFYVKAINDCAPGPASNVWCINPGAAPGTAVPAGFNPGVLGAQTSITPTPGATLESVDLGTVQGATTSCARKWLPILFIFAFILNLFIPGRVFIILPSLLAFLIDWYMLRSRCCLVNPIFCQYFWVGNILSYLLPFAFKKNRK